MSIAGILRPALYQVLLHGNSYRIERLCGDGEHSIESFLNDRLAYMDFTKTLESIESQKVEFRLLYGANDPHAPQEFAVLKDRLINLNVVGGGCTITWIFCNPFSAQEAYDEGLASMAKLEQIVHAKKTKFRKPEYVSPKSIDKSIDITPQFLTPIMESKDEEDEFAPISVSTMASLTNPKFD